MSLTRRWYESKFIALRHIHLTVTVLQLGAKSPKGSVMTKVGQSAPDSADLSTMNPILHNANMADDSTHSKASRSLQQRKYSYSSLGDGDHGNRDNSHGGSPSNYVLRNRSSSVSSGMSGMSLVDEVVENIHQAEVAISNAVMKEAKEFDQQFKATLLGHRTFHIAWTSYVVGLSFFGASVICAMTGNSFVDCLFHATSCVCSAGLSVMGANTLPKGVFIVQGLLAFFGGGCMMLLPTLIYRCICLRKYIPQCAERVKEPDLEDDKRIIIEEYLKIYYGSLILAAVIVFYILVWHICGTLMLFAALHRKPMEPELLEREFTFFDVALYTTVSAFANAGVTLSSKSLVHMGGNSVAIFVVTAVILAGNILMPVFLRWMLDFCLYVVKPYEQYNWITSALQYILDNPRKLTTHLFDRSSTLYLFQVMLLGKMFLFMYFLASNWYRETMYKYGDLGHVAGLGLFQVLMLCCNCPRFIYQTDFLV